MLVRSALFAALLLIAAPAGAVESDYTTLDLDNGSCKPIGPAASKEDEEMGSWRSPARATRTIR